MQTPCIIKKELFYGRNMKIKMHCTLLVALILASLAHAVEVRTVKKIDSFGKTFILDIGRYNNVEENEVSYFYQTRDEKKKNQRFLGKASAVKVYNNSSLWRFEKPISPDFIIRDPRVIILRGKEVLKGRRNFKISTRRKVLSPDQGLTNKMALDQSTDNKDLEVIKNKQAVQKLKGVEDVAADIELLGKAILQNTGQKYYREFDEIIDEKEIVEIDKVPSYEELQNIASKDQLANVSEHFQAKYAKAEYDIEQEFPKIRNSEVLYNPEVNKSSVTQEVLDTRARKEAYRERIIRSIRKQGPSWSREMDDKQLMEYVSEYGLESEIIRQKESVGNFISNEFSLYYASNMTSPKAESGDVEESSPARFLLSFEYPFYKNSVSWKDWSFEFAYENGKNNYDLGINAVSDESSFRAMIYYYLRYPPSRLSSLLPYAGAGLKLGSGTMNFGDTQQDYSITGLPIVSGGLKYRLDKTFSLKFFMNYELLSLTSKDEQSTSSSILTENSVAFINYGLGVGFNF